MEQHTTTLWNSRTRALHPALAHVTIFESGTWATAQSTEDGASDRLITSTQSASPATTLLTAGREQSRMLGSHFPTDNSRRWSQTSLSVMLAIIKASTTTETLP